MEELRKQTEEISKYIKAKGYNLVKVWECEWRDQTRTNSDIKNFVQEHTPPFRHQRDMKEDEIIQTVDERLSPMVQRPGLHRFSNPLTTCSHFTNPWV